MIGGYSIREDIKEMDREELEKELKEVQNKLDEDTFLVVEKECVEIYKKSAGYFATPVSNEDYS